MNGWVVTRRPNAAARVALALTFGFALVLFTLLRLQNVQIAAGLWILGTLLGIIDTAQTLRETVIERKEAGADEILSSIANANIRRETFRLAELLLLLLVGVIAVTGTAATLLSRLSVLAVVVLLVTNARLDRSERHDTDHLIRLARDLYRRRD